MAQTVSKRGKGRKLILIWNCSATSGEFKKIARKDLQFGGKSAKLCDVLTDQSYPLAFIQAVGVG
jgi:hypothetical protein